MSQVRNLAINNIKLVTINDDNMQVYINLARSYEAEFSNLTHKIPNELGVFEPDTMPISPYIGYLLYNDKTPIGFCVVGIENQINDVAEFYIIPSMRKNKFGYTLASAVFDIHPGSWQVRQIEGSDGAKAFWRKVINQYTQNNFTEALVSDPDWGVVTRQQFISNTKNNSNEMQILHFDGLHQHRMFCNSNTKIDTTIPSGSSTFTSSSERKYD